MSDLYKEKSVLDIARRQESKAHNELAYYKQQAENQELQLDHLHVYKDHCLDGLKTAKDTGLTPLHMRELQLLVKHINSVVETISYKVDASQRNLDIAEEVWQKKNQHYSKVKQATKNNKIKPIVDATDGWDKKVKSNNY